MDSRAFPIVRSLVAVALLATAAAPAVAQDADAKTPYVARVARDEATVRAQASAAHERIGTLKRGDEIVVHRVVREWIQIQVPSGIPVWLHGKYVRRDGDQATVTGNRLNLRPSPDTSGSVLGQVARGDQLRVVGVEGEWLQVLPPASARGWMLAALTEYVRPGDDAATKPGAIGAGPEAGCKADTTHTPAPGGPDYGTLVRDAFDRASKGQFGSRDFSEVRAILDTAKANNRFTDAVQAVERLLKVEEAREAQYQTDLADVKRKFKQENEELQALLAAIQQRVAELGTQKPQVPFTAIGTFDAMGMVWNRPGSHVIENEKGVRFYLTSTSVNLQKASWYGKKVGVRGQVVEIAGWGRVIEVHEIALLETKKAKGD